MKSSITKSILFSLLLFVGALIAGASIAGAATLTVGPTGMYATPCPAIKAAAAGDTITIDYNNGIPYQEPPDPANGNRSDCVWYTNNLTIVGINGRPILDASGEVIQKAILDVRGAGNVFSNLELRNSSTIPGQGDNAAGIRIDAQPVSTPGGGDITVQFCYIHDNEDGVLTANVGPGSGGSGYPDQKYLSANPYITFQYDEFGHNGINQSGLTHNMYVGFDTYETTTFTLQYSWSHDALQGHTVKSRNAINNIYYNLVSDQVGGTSYILDFPLGGTTYVVGNLLYKSKNTIYGANKAFMIFADYFDNTPSDPEYSVPYQDLHFVNNTEILDPTTFTPAYVVLVCQDADVTSCPAAKDGPSLSTNAVVENNIFVGPALGPGEKAELVVNQSTAKQSNNLQVTNTPAALAALFVDWANFNYHLVPGAAAIQAGLYPPTNNAGTADPKALAAYEYVHPSATVARPHPTGSTMDEGAYSYPRVDTPPSPGLSYTTAVTSPGTGTITLTGLPTPPSGQYNQAAFISENQAVIGTISSASSTTGTLKTTFTATAPLNGTTVVPIDIYVKGAHLVANVTVTPGPIALQSITLDRTYYPETTVHLTNPPTTASGPITVNLTTTDSSILYAPASVAVPVGALTAETGSETGSLWGQTPKYKTATISAIYGGVTKTVSVNVYAPYIGHFFCNTYPCAVVGGNVVNIAAEIAGEFPPSGAQVVYTSDTPSVIPNQTISAPAGKYNGSNLTTNTVTSTKSVGISVSVNGSSYGGVYVTVTPATGTNVVPNTGSGQSAAVGTNFANPLVAKVTNGGTPVSGVTVTFAGTGVSFPGGATAVTNASGLASVTAQPTAAGSLTVNATVSGGNGPATFYETGTGGTGAASIAVVSGSGQSANVGTNFTNPLVVVVKNSSGGAVSGATVTYAGTGVSFPNGATAVTNSSGQASVIAQPTAAGSLTVNATVAGVGSPAVFSETGTSSVSLVSVTLDQMGHPRTTVTLSAAAPAGGVVVSLSSSDTTALYTPATVTVPSGVTSAEDGTLIGSLWGQSPGTKTATLTATYAGVQKTLTNAWHTPGINTVACGGNPCNVTGGSQIDMSVGLNFGGAPYGGGPIQFTSSNTAVIPNQSFSFTSGQANGNYLLNTNTVTTATIVTMTANFNGATYGRAIQVNP